MVAVLSQFIYIYYLDFSVSEKKNEGKIRNITKIRKNKRKISVDNGN